MDEESASTNMAAAKELYYQARIHGMREDWLNRLRGKPTDLIPYEAVAAVLRSFQHRQLTELKSIPLDKIVGSVGRYRDFTRSFLPRESIGQQRWARIELLMDSATGLPAIDVYQIGDVYFVADGNHRVSVARANGFKEIDAYVTLIPAAADIEAGDSLDEAIIKAECAAFLAQTRLAESCGEIDIDFTQPGGYPALLEHIYTHRYFMGLNRNEQPGVSYRPITFPQAATDWYQNVYLPIVAAIRRYNLLRRFPRRTASDLYVWVSQRILELSEAGAPATPDTVVQEIAETAPSPFAATVLDVARRLVARWPLRGRRSREQNELIGPPLPRAKIRTKRTNPANPVNPVQEQAPEEDASMPDPNISTRSAWPILRTYDREHLLHLALPLGGIGTGTVSLGGRGNLRDWEIMNQPAKGFIPVASGAAPFFALRAQAQGAEPVTRLLEGPLDLSEYEGASGSPTPNHGLPRFSECSFAAAYPLGQVLLSDPAVPVQVRLDAFSPLIPADGDRSGLPVAVLRYVVSNLGRAPVAVSVAGVLPNFIGNDGSADATRPKANCNEFRRSGGIAGLFLSSDGVPADDPAWGTMALATVTKGHITHRTAWLKAGWGTPLLDFWDDFAADGALDERDAAGADMPVASLAVSVEVPAGGSTEITFILAWHFPNRYTWTPAPEADCGCGDSGCGCDGGSCGCTTNPNCIGNYYTTQYADAWDVIRRVVPQLPSLEADTVAFVRALCDSDLPPVVKEASLFNLSSLRSQTCFRTPDGRFFGWEGCGDRAGCCYGSCTHVWNYEQATAYLFGGLARSMREVEFGHATDERGLMSFRVNLPIARAQEFGKAAADGQMGCIMKMHRDWRLSGDDALLVRLWPKVRAALAFCWIPGGWDADRDGVMEGCQHNTMDVEYFGPNPQMGLWYLGALRAGEEMARHVGDDAFAATCRDLFERGSAWIDAHLFNGEYYEHEVRAAAGPEAIADGLLVGMGTADLAHPDYQLGPGCLVDQLVGQYMAHVCGLGHLVKPEHVRATLGSILKYNRLASFRGHFNCLRSFVLADESALLMAAYPHGRPANPFPYFTEVMTGFEYAAAIGMLQEGLTAEGLQCIADIRDRYDGRKRSPFDEAECGHHYARAMASWAAILSLTGFRYSGVTQTMTFAAVEGKHFWSNGDAWGACELARTPAGFDVTLSVLGGTLKLKQFEITDSTVSSFQLLTKGSP